MSDAPGGRPDDGGSDMTMYRPAREGGLEPAPGEPRDYRESLRSRRWDAAPLASPEVDRTDPRVALAYIAGLCALTFVLLVVGYASGFWG